MKGIDISERDMRIEPDGDLWSAYCDRLGLDSFGTTKKEAETNLVGVISLYVKSLIGKGLLVERMKEKGISVQIPSHRKEIAPGGRGYH